MIVISRMSMSQQMYILQLSWDMRQWDIAMHGMEDRSWYWCWTNASVVRTISNKPLSSLLEDTYYSPHCHSHALPTACHWLPLCVTAHSGLWGWSQTRLRCSLVSSSLQLTRSSSLRRLQMPAPGDEALTARHGITGSKLSKQHCGRFITLSPPHPAHWDIIEMLLCLQCYCNNNSIQFTVQIGNSMQVIRRIRNSSFRLHLLRNF